MTIDESALSEALKGHRSTQTLVHLCRALWARDDVQALLLTGSVAGGSHDDFSDIDFWVGVDGDAVDRWQTPDLEALFGGHAIGRRSLPTQPHGFVHSILLADATVVDLCVQVVGEARVSPPCLLLAARSDAIAAQVIDAAEPATVPATEDRIRPLLEGFWLNTLKHHKVLHRGHHHVCLAGLRIEHHLLLQLWWIQAHGRMPGTIVGQTLHDMVLQWEHARRAHPVATEQLLVASPGTGVAALEAAIQRNRTEVGCVGRALAGQLGFAYPQALEDAARQDWERYRALAGDSTPAPGTPASTIPLLEHDDTVPAVIEPAQVVRRRDLPERVVITFFQEVLDSLTDELELTRLHPIRSEMGDLPIYRASCEGTPIGILPGAVGAALAGACLEEAIARGGRRFVVCGGAGVLDGDIGSGDIVVPTAALRDEGTSYHYLAPSRLVEPTPAALAAVTQTLDTRGITYRTGTTWTTDGFYRETRGKVARRRAEGCITVEMEAAALFAVARFRGVELAQLLYGGDDVGGPAWDPRDFGKKVPAREVVLRLALEAVLAL